MVVGVRPGWELLLFEAGGRGVRAECCLNKSVHGKLAWGPVRGVSVKTRGDVTAWKMRPFCCLDPILGEDLSPHLWASFHCVTDLEVGPMACFK